MKRICIFLVLLALLLAGCSNKQTDATGSTASTPADTSTPTEVTEPKPLTGWVKEGDKTYYIKEDGSRHTGWLELDRKRYYLDSDGVLHTGWLELDGKRYYFADDGVLHIGWLELDGKVYYMKADGSVLQGKATIGQNTYYFTAQGERIILVNPWNMLPADYVPNLVRVEGGYKVDAVCKDALVQMLADCRDAGFDPAICSAYRTHDLQIELYNNKVSYYLNRGYEYDEARAKAGQVVAVPGTSEHELGLALDLVDDAHWDLDESQEKRPTQKWLMEHCWEYGFILRYPNGKSEQTGIIYEPWHYRYVGVELAMELKNSGMCLEEYFASLS